MVNMRQLRTLVKQELRRGLRSQYIIFSFILFPLMMWGIQGGVQSVATSSLDSSGETIYVANMDAGINNINLGELIVDGLNDHVNDEDSTIYDARLNTSITGQSIEQMQNLVRDEGLSPLVLIPQNFSQVHDNFNISENPEIPQIILLNLPSDQFITLSTQSALEQIIALEPFTQVMIDKIAGVQNQLITFEGEETAGNPIEGIGFAAFLTILLAVMAPAAFVSSSFAGERENRTLEALLALPMTRSSIMGGKIIAGLILTILFAIMNLVGIQLFNIISPESSIDLNFSQMVIISAILLLTSFVAIGFGIAIASFAKDQKTANTVYQMIMLIPTMLVGFTVLFNGVPEGFDMLYLVPWTHSMAVLMKSVYPQTYANVTLTDSVGMDILLHLGYLFIFVIGFVYISSKLFDRESIIS